MIHTLAPSGLIVRSGYVGFEMHGKEGDDDKRFYREGAVLGAEETIAKMYQFKVSALNMFASDFQKGQPILLNHEKRESVGYGQTAESKVDDNLLYARFYILRDYEPGSGAAHKSNEVIKAVEDGFLKDLSIGFRALVSECSICGGSYYDYGSCHHWRGERVRVIDPETGEETMETVVEIVHQAEAMELSLVWNGEYRGAGVYDSDMFSAGGFEDAAKRDAIANDKGGNGKAHSFASPPPSTTNNEEDPTVPNEDVQAKLSTAESQVKSLEIQTEAQKTTIEGLESKITEKDKEIAELKAKETENGALIDAGKQLREETESQALEDFVAATSDCTEAQKAEMQTFFAELATLEQVKTHGERWAEHAAKALPTDRQTSDDAPTVGSGAKDYKPSGRVRY